MINRKGLTYSRNADVNDMIHMGSDHRCVIAQFVFPATKKNDSQIEYNAERKTSETAPRRS